MKSMSPEMSTTVDRPASEAAALLLKPEEAARRLSIARSSLYELLLCGEIDSIKIGRSRRVPLSALTGYIDRKLREQGA